VTTINDFQDVEITCFVCGATFTWTASQQFFFYERNLSPPRRCAVCLDRKKAIQMEVKDDTRAYYEQQLREHKEKWGS